MFLTCVPTAGDFTNFTGNFGKLGLSLETVALDILFIVQHYVLYADKRDSLDELRLPLVDGQLAVAKYPSMPRLAVPDGEDSDEDKHKHRF